MEKEFTKKVEEVYDDWAQTYDEEENPALIAEEDYAIHILDVQREDHVLELGCGTGRNLTKLANLCDSLEGVDISEGMLSIAKKQVPKAKVECVDIEKRFPYPNESMDKILSSFVISHIQNLEKFFAEISRILRKDGTLVITTIHPDADFSDYEPRKKRFRLMKYNINLQHSLQEIKTSCESANLRITAAKDISISNELRQFYTRESYEKIKETPFLLILKIKKHNEDQQ